MVRLLPCFFPFGYLDVPNEAREMREWEKDIEETCLRLTPPLLLASYDSWKYPESDLDQHASQVASRIKIVEQWVGKEVPRLLNRLYDLLEERDKNNLITDSYLRIRGCIVVAASVYVNPRKESDGSSEAEIDRDPWTNATNRLLSLRILQHPFLSLTSIHNFTVAQLDSNMISYILDDYLKPIFRSTPSSSINASTGRIAKIDPNLSRGATIMSGGGASMQDETMWKGGDLETSSQTDVLGKKILFDVEHGDEILQKRHRALGCFNVLYICCSSILTAQESGTDLWQDNWPLILPPLLALLEDSTPLYRLLGSRILVTTLLKSKSTSSLVGTLLLKTGVATLFRQKLEANLTFISTKLSAALLQSSAEALIQLTQATTMDTHLSLHLPRNAVLDGGKERFEHWSKLMEEGVIRVWAYAPTLVSSLDDVLLNLETNADENGIESDTEASDVINASIQVLDRLAQPDLLGLGMARYLDLALEFLSAQLIGLEMRLNRHEKAEQASLSLNREICATKAMQSLLFVCKEAPGIRKWSSRCLDAAARCWVLLQDQQDRRQVTILFSHLHGTVQALSNAHPAFMSQQFQKLLDLDRTVFASLVEI